MSNIRENLQKAFDTYAIAKTFEPRDFVYQTEYGKNSSNLYMVVGMVPEKSEHITPMMEVFSTDSVAGKNRINFSVVECRLFTKCEAF